MVADNELLFILEDGGPELIERGCLVFVGLRHHTIIHGWEFTYAQVDT